MTQNVTFLDALGSAESQLGAAPDVNMEGRRPPLLDYRIARNVRQSKPDHSIPTRVRSQRVHRFDYIKTLHSH